VAAIENILLRITGDEDDAERSLKSIATDLEAFSRLSATAEAEVDTGSASARLEELEAQLEALDEETVTPEVKVNTAAARAELAGLQRRLAAIERNDINLNLDVDVKRGLLDDLRSLGRNVNALQRGVETFEPAGKSLADRLRDVSVNLGFITTQARTAVPILAVLAPVITSVAGAVGALVASFSAAAAGAGALAVALGGVFGASVLAGFAAFQRFQQQSEKQGTAAYALAQAFEDVQKAFKQLLPAVDPILRALARIAQAVAPLIRQIAPAFRQFGKAAGDALGIVAQALANPQVRQGISQLIRLSSEALGPMVKIAVRLGRIFLNIANAAMPHLVALLEDVAAGLGIWRRGSEDTKSLGKSIGGLVGHLRAWLSLIGAISDLFIGFVEAAAPAGKELVEWITQGAQSLADWMKSAEGQEAIRSFLTDVIPLFKEIVGFAGQLIRVFLQAGQLLAPILTPIIGAFRQIVSIVGDVIGAILKLPEPVRRIAGLIIAFFVNPFQKLRWIVTIVLGAFQILGKVVSAVLGLIGNIAQKIIGAFGPAVRWVVNALKDVWEFIKSLPGKIKNALVGLWNIITWPFRKAKEVIGAAMDWVLDKVRSVIDEIEKAAQTAKDVVDFLGGGLGDESDIAPAASVESVIKSRINEMLQAGKTLQDLSKEFKDYLRTSGFKPSDFFPSEKAMRDAGSRAGKAGAQGMRDQFPGSEPKAHDSPLRRFDRAGQALMESFVSGMRGGGRAASREMAHGLRVGLGQGARKLAVAGAQREGRRSTFNIPVTVAGGGSPDAQAFVGTVSRRLRAKGLSIQ
jgi:phage-related protein